MLPPSPVLDCPSTDTIWAWRYIRYKETPNTQVNLMLCVHVLRNARRLKLLMWANICVFGLPSSYKYDMACWEEGPTAKWHLLLSWNLQAWVGTGQTKDLNRVNLVHMEKGQRPLTLWTSASSQVLTNELIACSQTYLCQLAPNYHSKIIPFKDLFTISAKTFSDHKLYPYVQCISSNIASSHRTGNA